MGLKPRAERQASGSDYRELVERLFAARRFGVELGVERLRVVMAALGDPQLRIKTRIVVAGTNGKGSTSAFLEAIAIESGVLTGVFSSPHLAQFVERFRIGRENVGRGPLCDAAAKLWESGGDSLTFFEQCTALALIVFADAGVELGIFEVGLGGRLDATKVCDPHLVAVTGVALDHQDILGETLEEIAAEKIGAAEPGTDALLGMAPGLTKLTDAARDRGVNVEVAEPALGTLGLAGEFQRSNAGLAAKVALRLGMEESAIARGLASAQLPARFEILGAERLQPQVIVDGAHNGAGAEALGIALDGLDERETIMVLGINGDKDVESILSPLVARADRAWVCAGRSDRALPASDIKDRLRRLDPQLEVDVVLRSELASRVANAESRYRVVLAGSLLFVGELRAELLGASIDADLLSDPLANRRPNRK